MSRKTTNVAYHNHCCLVPSSPCRNSGCTGEAPLLSAWQLWPGLLGSVPFPSNRQSQQFRGTYCSQLSISACYLGNVSNIHSVNTKSHQKKKKILSESSNQTVLWPLERRKVGSRKSPLLSHVILKILIKI